MAKILYDDDRPAREVSPPDGISYHLKELYEWLECDYVDVVNLRDGRILIIDDCGKDCKAVNDAATFEAHAAGVLFPNDYICGSVLICKDEEFK